MKKKSIFYIAAIAAAAGLSACGGDDPTYEVKFTEPTVNVVTNRNSGVTVISSAPSLNQYRFDLVKNKVAVDIAGLTLGEENIAIGIEDITLLSQSGAFQFKGGKKVGSNYDITGYSGVLYDAGVVSSFDIVTPRTSSYLVTTYPQVTLFRKTSTQVVSDGNVYNWDGTVCTLKLIPSTMKATLVLDNVNFAERMPALSGMTFDGLNIKPDGTGIDIENEKFIPTISDTPYPRYEITDFEAELKGGDIEITFTCMGTYDVTIKAKMQAGSSTQLGA